MARDFSPSAWTLPVEKRRSSTRAHQEANSSGTQAISNKENAGKTSAKPAVTVEPSMAPTELPMAINANKRLPWLLLKQSAMKPQNTVTTNRANTLVQI